MAACMFSLHDSQRQIAMTGLGEAEERWIEFGQCLEKCGSWAFLLLFDLMNLKRASPWEAQINNVMSVLSGAFLSTYTKRKPTREHPNPTREALCS